MNIRQSLRIIFRNKTYSILNILGLAIGITCASLILLWVEDEVTYNDFPKQKQLYALYQNQKYGDEVRTFKVAPNPLAAALKEEVTGIRNVTRYSDNGTKCLFALNNKMLYETGAYADSSIFSMLDIEFIKGNAKTAFDAAYPLVITEDMASRFFGKDNPIGQTLKKDNGEEYQITAVIKNSKKNSEFTFNWLIPFQQRVKDFIATGWQSAETHWGSNWMTDYVELDASADINQVNAQIKDLLKKKRNSPDDGTTLFLYPFNKLKLYGEFKDGYPTGTGYIRYVRLFFWIAVVILVIACINFMNLSTARSQKRVLEVGVRKTFGASRLRLIWQFISESAVITSLSLLFAILFIIVLLPPFNHLTEKELSLGLTNPVHWIGLLSVGVLCAFFAGSYPAFFLSSFPPIDVLRKLATRGGGGTDWLRKGLVTFQFTVSLTLIICTAFIYLQIQHTKNRSLGMDIEQVLTLGANQDILDHFEPLKQELLATGVVENAGLSDQMMINLWSNGGNWQWQGKPDHIDPLISHVRTSPELLPTLDIKLKEGRYFVSKNAKDEADSPIIINETLAKLMGDEGRVGGRIWQGQGNGEYPLTIIGIVQDFVFNDMYKMKGEPVLFYNYYGNTSDFNLFIRLKPGNTQDALKKVESVLKKIDPNHPFEYEFMDEQFNQKFKSTLLVGKLSGLFAVLAIFISCLGLFGLTAFLAEQRTKEIGIRKVLGASVLNIVELLGRNFMMLIAIAFIIAIPLGWWIMHRWLQDYEYRIDINWWIFAGSGLLVLLIAMLTVSFQSIKAATANPVKSIKSE